MNKDFAHKMMEVKTPHPCFRAMYDHVQETLYSPNRIGKFKKDANGILRCQGYIKAMNDAPADECEVCPFYLDTYSSFWAKRD